MLTVRIIPCLDVRDGRVVKGVQFQGLRDAGDPALQAEVYQAQGADEITMLDVSATPDGRATAAETVRRIRRRISLPLTVGGGVRSVQSASDLLDAGADKVSANTAAVERPGLIDELSRRYGAQCTVLAVDAAWSPELNRFEVITHSGKRRTGLDAVAWVRQAVERGAGEILLTSWDRDGTRQGYDLPLLRAICGGCSVPVVASGGASGAAHMAQAIEAGASAVLAASIFHFGELTVAALKEQLAAFGVEVRR